MGSPDIFFPAAVGRHRRPVSLATAVVVALLILDGSCCVVSGARPTPDGTRCRMPPAVDRWRSSSLGGKGVLDGEMTEFPAEMGGRFRVLKEYYGPPSPTSRDPVKIRRVNPSTHL